MKKLLPFLKINSISLSIFALFLIQFDSNAQCGWRGVLNNGTVTAGCNAFGATVQVPSTSYSQLTVVTGVNYSVSTCGGAWDSQLTGFNGTTFQTGTYNDDNGPSCNPSTAASFDWTSTYSGTLNIQVERFNCGSTWPGTSTSLQVRQNTTVTNTTSTATICVNSTKALTATLGGTHSSPTVNWSIVSGGGSIAGTTYTPNTAGSKTIRATVGVCSSDVTFTVDALSTLGTLTNGTTREFCNSAGDFGPGGANIGIPTVSGQTGSVSWDWGSNNGTWNPWVTGASSGTSTFPKQVGTSNADADRTRYRVTNGVCPAVTSGTTLISNYWNEAPTSLATTDNNFCSNAGGNLTLTATFPTNINMRGTVRFYSGSCGGTLVGSVTPAAGSSTADLTIAKPTATTDYFVRYEPGTFAGCANTTCASVTVNVNAIPAITSATAAASPICASATTTLTANGVAGAGTTVTWWTGSGGTGTNLGTGLTTTQGPGTYYARVTGTCTPAVEASVTVNSLTPSSQVVLAGSSVATAIEQCTESGWTYYGTSANPNDWVFAINKNGNTFTASVDVTVSGSVFSSINTATAGFEHGSYLMPRYWNVTLLTGSISTTVGVRFFYNPTELSDAQSARDAAWAPYSATASRTALRWFKSDGVAFNASVIAGIDGNSFNNFPNIDLSPSSGTINGVTYAEFNGITSFSGGTAGYGFSSLGTGLPVKLTSFTSQAIDNSFIKLDWATALEIDNRGFEIERSEDGINFTTIGWKDGNGNSTEPKYYSFDDKTVSTGITYYYRLKQIDFDGDSEYSNIVSSRINGKDEFTVSDFIPTEVKGNTKLEIFTTNNRDINISVFNTLGQPILSRNESLTVGNNKIEFSFDDLPAGTYMSSIKSNNEFISRKFVVIR